MSKLKYLRDDITKDFLRELYELPKLKFNEYKRLVIDELPKYCPENGTKLNWRAYVTKKDSNFDIYTGEPQDTNYYLNIISTFIHMNTTNYIYNYDSGDMTSCSPYSKGKTYDVIVG